MLCLEGRELGSSVPGRGVPCQAGQLCAHLSQGRLSERRQKMKPGDEAEKQGSSCRHVSPYSHLEQNVQRWRDDERSCWQGPVAQLLPSGAQPKKPSPLPDAGSHSSKAQGQAPATPPRLGHCSGSGAIVWTHDTCTIPSSPSLVERPSLAAQLPKAVPNTKGFFVPLPPPQVSQNLAHCLNLLLSRQ